MRAHLASRHDRTTSRLAGATARFDNPRQKIQGQGGAARRVRPLTPRGDRNRFEPPCLGRAPAALGRNSGYSAIESCRRHREPARGSPRTVPNDHRLPSGSRSAKSRVPPTHIQDRSQSRASSQSRDVPVNRPLEMDLEMRRGGSLIRGIHLTGPRGSDQGVRGGMRA